MYRDGAHQRPCGRREPQRGITPCERDLTFGKDRTCKGSCLSQRCGFACGWRHLLRQLRFRNRFGPHMYDTPPRNNSSENSKVLQLCAKNAGTELKQDSLKDDSIGSDSGQLPLSGGRCLLTELHAATHWGSILAVACQLYVHILT